MSEVLVWYNGATVWINYNFFFLLFAFFHHRSKLYLFQAQFDELIQLCTKNIRFCRSISHLCDIDSAKWILKCIKGWINFMKYFFYFQADVCSIYFLTDRKGVSIDFLNFLWVYEKNSLKIFRLFIVKRIFYTWNSFFFSHFYCYTLRLLKLLHEYVNVFLNLRRFVFILPHVGNKNK